MFELTKISGETANFSVILPGSCNAKCGFCFWKRSTAESPMFAQQLAWFLAALGPKVTQISLTGGEPTLSPVFDDVITALRQRRETKIVLTTNGAALKEKLPLISGVVQHLNLSRHAIDDAENRSIFGTDTVPTKAEIAELCDMANTLNIDVMLNKIVPHDYADMDEFTAFVEFAKSVGASSVAFRKDYSVNSLDATPLEKHLGRAGITRSCPVCATNSYLFHGMPVHFKMSLEEPSEVLPYIYEFIYHPDGKLTEDWKGEKQIEFVQVAPRTIRRPDPTPQVHYVSSGGCGQRSSRRGC